MLGLSSLLHAFKPFMQSDLSNQAIRVQGSIILPRQVVMEKSELEPAEHAADDEPRDSGVVDSGKAGAHLAGVAGHGVVEGRAREAHGSAAKEGQEDHRLVAKLTEGKVDGDQGGEQRRAHEVSPDVGRLVVHTEHRVEAE